MALNQLQKHYSDAVCALHFSNPFELLIATILSAQCTDERVNQVTAVLFPRYPRPKDLADSDLEDIEALIRPVGFYRVKAKNIRLCARGLVDRHSGEVPKNLDDLVNLAGVGRKTANVVLGNAYSIASGVVVDTHVTRLTNRFGWVSGKNAELIEQQLNDLIPREHWIQFPHWLISHGRKICRARSPHCSGCFLFDACPKIAV